MICCGQEQILSIMFGSITAGLLVPTSREALIVMAGGQSIGAGSKLVGILIGILFEGCLFRYAHATTLTGYSASRKQYSKLSSW